MLRLTKMVLMGTLMLTLYAVPSAAIPNPISNEFNKLFDKNKDKSIDGKDWQRMSSKDRISCAGGILGLLMGTGGADIDFEDRATQQKLVAMGEVFAERLNDYYRAKNNRSVSVADAMMKLVNDAQDR